MSDDLVKRYRELQEIIGGCHDGHCVVRKPKGMHTNGGCTCLEDLRLHERSRIGHLLRYAQEMANRIEELEAENIALKANLAKAVGALTRIERTYYQEATNPSPEIHRRMAAKMNGIARDAQDALAELTGDEDGPA